MAKKQKSTPLFPLFLKLHGHRCLVVGAGKVSEGKITGLLNSGARITVIAPTATLAIQKLHRAKKVRWTKREFRPADLDGMLLVVAATNVATVHRAIYREAKARKILCNIVDVPPLCDFYYPALVRRGELQIAISTAGSSPSLARRLREEMETKFGPVYAAWLKHLASQRKKLLAQKLKLADRLQLLKEQASAESFARFAAKRAHTGPGPAKKRRI